MATCAQAMSGHKAPITADGLMPALVSTIAEALDLDPAIALDMGMPLMLDDESMTTFIKDEIVANADHVLALKAQEQMRRDPGTDMTPITDKDSFLTTQLTLISKMVALCVSEPASVPFMPDDLRKKEITGEGHQSDRCHTCTACMDSKAWFEVHAADCKHEYCEDCLRRLFEDSYKDESLFPPRCCQQPFPVENNASLTVHLPLHLVSRWPLRKIEVNTKDRTYCHKCGTFILPATIMNNRAKCGTCDIDTCSKCKKPYHFFGCLVDVAEQQVIELARKEGWQRCAGCRGMVELKKGCHHMTCRCGYQFCYICGARWKTCKCKAFSERRLLERVDEIINRAPPPNPVARAAMVQVVRRQVLERHECEHRTWWRSIRGHHRCEHCNRRLFKFILECPGCMIRACVTCRYNRL